VFGLKYFLVNRISLICVAEMAEKHEENMATVIPLEVVSEVKTRNQSLDSDIVQTKVNVSTVPDFKPIS
jgi:hypothetical protein